MDFVITMMYYIMLYQLGGGGGGGGSVRLKRQRKHFIGKEEKIENKETKVSFCTTLGSLL